MVELYRDYVCPNCFHTLDDCECELRPYSLIMIDNGIQEHIRTLRNKGYVTTGCCESHEDICISIYISFNTNYGFGATIPLPEGFKFNKKKNAIIYDFNRKLSREEVETEKKNKLDALLEWCKNLPNNN